MTKIAIIGGTGLENPDLLEQANHVQMDTPYGKPSSDILTGKLMGVDIAILSRHGFKHSIPPSKVNNLANIYALKELGCTHILATTACGSLRQDFKPGDLVVLDQFIDFTKNRKSTFFDEFQGGELSHTSMADPFDEDIRNRLIRSAEKIGVRFHRQGTVVTIEGPRFSTRAESKMFQLLGADVINMSTVPEAILANEMKIPYASIAMATDYDCWNSNIKEVTWEDVTHIFNKNVKNVIELILTTLTSYNLEDPDFFEIN